MEKIIYAGLLLIFAGFFLVFAGSIADTWNKSVKVEGAGIIMIGPVPIMFGDKRLLVPLAVSAIVLIAIYLLLWRR